MEFQTSIEVASELERRIRVQVPAAAVDDAVGARLRELGRTLTLKGFRPGKVPRSVIQKRYGREVRLQVIQEQLQQICRTAIQREGLDPAGPAEISQEPTEGGDELVFTATLEVYPTFTVTGLDSLVIEKPVVEVIESDTDELLQRLRKQARSWQAVARPARQGDRLTVDFCGHVAGIPVDSATGTGIELVLGEGQVSSDAERKLTGLSAGMTAVIETAQSSLIPAETLGAGQARFDVSVIEVAEERLPALDADFCRRHGIASGEIADLRQAAIVDMRREADTHVREILRARLARHLREAIPVTLPRILCKQETGKLSAKLNLPADALRAAAERNVHWALIIRQVFQQEKMRVTREEMNRKIATSGSPQEDQEARQNWFYTHPDSLTEIEYAVMEDKVIDWLMQHARVTTEPVSFVDLIALRKKPVPGHVAPTPF